MRFNPQAGITQLLSHMSSRRRSTRFDQDTLQSSLGTVLDISASGVRILSGRAPTGWIDLQLYDLSEVVTIPAEVVWTERVSLFRHQVGLRFGEIAPALAQRLSRMATDNRRRHSMRPA